MMKLLTVYCLLVIILLNYSEGSIFSKLKGKIKEFFSKKTKIPKEGEFVRESELYYPGMNRQLLEIIGQMWEQYYECLNISHTTIGPHRSVMPEAVMVFEGGSVKFGSKVCVSPAEAEDPDEVTWMHHTKSMNSTQPVQFGEHTLVSPEDKMLHLYNLQQTDSGQFLCKMGNAVTASYFLHVVNDSEPIVNVYPDTAPRNKPHRRPPKIVNELNLEVFSNWEQWSACSQCNEVGKRVRFGMCTVKLIDEDAVSNEGSNSTTTSITIDDTQENIDDQIKKKSEVFEIRNEKGNIIERANNSAGIYSTLQGVPSIRPDVQRVSLYEDTTSNRITIKCPGNLNSDTPVLWQAGDKYINPMLILQQSKGRIYMDGLNHLIINKPRVADSNIYSSLALHEAAALANYAIEAGLYN
uniref:(California timema) hypothetical protein n=1 Tax=Timema californicum TaxID=61474 RepID=A0A7R9J1R6_TIMCA|nr:unnamed protein product [Timema californicum]